MKMAPCMVQSLWPGKAFDSDRSAFEQDQFFRPETGSDG
jgi:hypothetical protein